MVIRLFWAVLTAVRTMKASKKKTYGYGYGIPVTVSLPYMYGQYPLRYGAHPYGKVWVMRVHHAVTNLVTPKIYGV